MSSDEGKAAVEAVEGWADGWLTEADVLARLLPEGDRLHR